MSFALFDAVVPPCRLRLAAALSQITKAEDHCARLGLPDAYFIQARFASDMHPYSYQIKSLAVHSRGAVDGIKAGVFRPDRTTPPETFTELSALLAESLRWIDGVTRDEIDGLSDLPIRFEGGRSFADFTGSQFLMTFALPNFYFHATTAYDLLRWKGLAIGKLDYLGDLPFQKFA